MRLQGFNSTCSNTELIKSNYIKNPAGCVSKLCTTNSKNQCFPKVTHKQN